MRVRPVFLAFLVVLVLGAFVGVAWARPLAVSETLRSGGVAVRLSLFESVAVPVRYADLELAGVLVATCPSSGCDQSVVADLVRSELPRYAMVGDVYSVVDGRVYVPVFAVAYELPDYPYDRSKFLTYASLDASVEYDGRVVAEDNVYDFYPGGVSSYRPFRFRFDVDGRDVEVSGEYRVLGVMRDPGECVVALRGAVVFDNMCALDTVVREFNVPGCLRTGGGFLVVTLPEQRLRRVYCSRDEVAGLHEGLNADAVEELMARNESVDVVTDDSGRAYLLLNYAAAYETIYDSEWFRDLNIMVAGGASSAASGGAGGVSILSPDFWTDFMIGGLAGATGFIDAVDLMSEFGLGFLGGLGIFALSFVLTYFIIRLALDIVRKKKPEWEPFFWFMTLMFGDIGALTVAALALIF